MRKRALEAIPRAREILIALMPELTEAQQAKVGEALALMYRRKYARNPAPDVSRKITPEVVAAVLASVAANPRVAFETIAMWHGIRGGRVSEIMHGDWS